LVLCVRCHAPIWLEQGRTSPFGAEQTWARSIGRLRAGTRNFRGAAAHPARSAAGEIPLDRTRCASLAIGRGRDGPVAQGGSGWWDTLRRETVIRHKGLTAGDYMRTIVRLGLPNPSGTSDRSPVLGPTPSSVKTRLKRPPEGSRDEQSQGADPGDLEPGGGAMGLSVDEAQGCRFAEGDVVGSSDLTCRPGTTPGWTALPRCAGRTLARCRSEDFPANNFGQGTSEGQLRRHGR